MVSTSQQIGGAVGTAALSTVFAAAPIHPKPFAHNGYRDRSGHPRLHMGGVRDAREKYRGHRWFDDCVEFCEKYDQNYFDTQFDHRPLESFRPMVDEVFGREPWPAH
ncbi:hypothetical protein [Mycolicibacterium litorale]|uniref:Uncharacterized protein n=1 Tax=Mycolicibacterium litorale TaxID=758802 RepID=A0AAD1MRD9_9MYCO|nr:hypothetical protein [Mycolicibacterium litorale]TDY08185.1 hypothetical protein BCL50_0248 [Mycolicibacterium litorale]BBY16109.1 hypothetical protein MLIT_17010 [Mycolicibacterium litorale]